MRLRRFLVAIAATLAPNLVAAHPHEWIDAAAEMLFNPDGQIEGVRQHWRFDEGFTVFALQGLDTNGDGKYSADELKPLAQENVESLSEYDYFTYLLRGDDQQPFGTPKDYFLDYDGDRLTLHFTLPLKSPLDAKQELTLQVYDPEYYIAFSFPSVEAVRLDNAPAGCRLEVYPAAGPDIQSAALLATVGADQRELPANMQSLTGGIDNDAIVNCGGPTIARSARAGKAADAAKLLAEGQSADLTALPALDPKAAIAPATSGPAAAPPAPAIAHNSAPSTAVIGQPAGAPSALAPSQPASRSVAAAAPANSLNAAPTAPPTQTRPSVYRRFMARLMAVQTAFNKELTGTLKQLKSSGSAFWWLGGISFVYGIVHAAGPGHGKMVISSYLVANEERLRRGVSIAFLSALLQAVVAVAIVGLMAMLLNMTSMAITSTANLFESGSYALVAALGLYLLFTKGRRAWSILQGGRAEDHHAHAHHGHAWRPNPANDHRRARKASADRHVACSCGHDHTGLQALDRRNSGAAAAIFSVGIRPCSGALIVLVFALAQGIFWAGVASTFLMAFGTALTVAALAALAVGAKDIARRLSRGDDRRATRLMLGLEITGALLITIMGAVLFAGSLGASPGIS